MIVDRDPAPERTIDQSADTDRAAAAPAAASLLLVTGLSGAGKSTALQALEDAGYEVVDNLPVSLLGALVEPRTPHDRPIAIGVDVRTRDFGGAPFFERLDTLAGATGLAVRIIYLDCDDEVIVRRYSQTRRRHPLAGSLPIADGIRDERRRLAPLRDLADPVIDTSDLTPADLRRLMVERFSPDRAPEMAISILSFAFGQGVPRQADLVFDVRFLRNPHYVDALRPQTGRDDAVGAYIAADPDFAGFFERLTGLLLPLLPRYREEGKSYLTVAVGCTGGRHRSVYLAERLAEAVRAAGYRAALRHRELGIDEPLQ
jgi:UPF0042 nucleotide-binding protein